MVSGPRGSDLTRRTVLRGAAVASVGAIAPEQWTSTFRVVDTALVPGAPTRTPATFAAEDGRPGAQLV